jgi:hypothetical protein
VRRQLNSRTELLSHIAVTHQIAVAGLGKDDEDDEDDEALGRGSTVTRAHGDETVGGGGRSLTLTDMRRNQQKVERRYGSFVLSRDETALRYRYEPATVLGTRQGATKQQQQQQGVAGCQGACCAYGICSAPAATGRRRRFTSRRTSRRGWRTMV